MRSRTFGLERRARLALALALLLLVSCGKPEVEKVDEAPTTLGESLRDLGQRMSVVLKHRKDILEMPYFQSTTVVEEVQRMSLRIDLTTQNIVKLSEYDAEAEKQNLSEEERLRHKGQDLASLQDFLDHYDRVFGNFVLEREKNGPLFFDNYGKTIYCNQVLQLFIDNDVPCKDEQKLMLDYSRRLKDSRSYWCQELSNVLRGLEPDAETMTLALGMSRGLAPELAKIHGQMTRAASEFHRLRHSRQGLDERLAWSRATLQSVTADEAWKSQASSKLDALESQIVETRAATESALKDVLIDTREKRDLREALIAREATLLSDLNQVVLVEAQKCGWPLPQ